MSPISTAAWLRCFLGWMVTGNRLMAGRVGPSTGLRNVVRRRPLKIAILCSSGTARCQLECSFKPPHQVTSCPGCMLL
jgi:hypothetical protein